MKLTFRTIAGKTFAVEAEDATTVGDLKAQVSASQGPEFSTNGMKLVYKGKVLDSDSATIAGAGVSEAGFIVVFVQKKAAPPAAAAALPAPAATTAASAVPTAAPTAEAAAAPAAVPAVIAPAAAAAATAAAAGAAAVAPSVAPAAPGAAADVYSSAASGLLAGDALASAINNICDMGFVRDQVVLAMRAAFNNPERAVEYLATGNIPMPPPGQAAAAAAAAAAPAAVAGPAARAVAAGGPEAAGPNAAPFNMFMGGGGDGGAAEGQAAAAVAAAAGGGGEGGAGPLDFLRDNLQFQTLRRAVQANPQILVPMVQELGRNSPALLQLITANQAEFMSLLAEHDGQGAEEGQGDGQGAHMGGMVIALTQEENAVVLRLEALGFDRNSCIEAYLACDKNEDLAANYLATNMFD